MSFGGARAERRSLCFVADGVNRDQFFAALFVVGCANGFAGHVITSVETAGLWQALFQTFGISILVWFACSASLFFLLRHGGGDISPNDRRIGLGSLLFFAIPITSLSWLTVTGLAAYVYWTSSKNSERRRGALLLVAVTVPMFWARILFTFFGEFLLKIDAFFVSLILGSERTGNIVAFPDGSGHLLILHPCSSFHNVSLAFVAWTTISQCMARQWSPKDIYWYFSACLAVVIVNVTRVSLVGFYPENYNLIHGEVGAQIAGWLTLCLIVGISVLGAKREIFSRL